MKLYEEIIFLEHHFKGKYVVENVIPYYTPLMDAKKRGRHLYWTDFTKYKGTQRADKIARNLVDYEAGRTILETVLEIQRKSQSNQVSLF